ncbi:unnamed protein product [Victoria cruziana]
MALFMGVYIPSSPFPLQRPTSRISSLHSGASSLPCFSKTHSSPFMLPTVQFTKRQRRSATLQCSNFSVETATDSPTSSIGKRTKVDTRRDVRNIAIVAHVDHGKTTLVDAMLRQAKVFRDNQVVKERVMDSNDLERERGITILSKNTSIFYKDTKINIIDTPGHSDFGGEVERVLNMVEGVLLVVDSVEGPMPQTRFVLKKALEFGHAVVVVVNKIDRPSARPDFVVNSTFELFIELNATDEQCDFQVIYANAIKGKAGLAPDDLADDLGPLFEAIVRCIPEPVIDKDGALQMLVCTPDEACRSAKVSELFVFENFSRTAVDGVDAGDICAVCGIDDILIGETIADKSRGKALPTIKIEEPTVKMAFSVNISPFVGREGKYVTSRKLRDRLYRELERNLAMKVEDGESADTFIVSGRGTLHITILIENINEGTVMVKYKIPTRGLLGLRNDILTASRGTAILSTVFDGYGPWAGDMSTRDQGSLVAFEDGTTTSYALASSQERGQMFVGPGIDVYKGQIVGIHQRPGDLVLNVCKKKAATNVRSNKEQTEIREEREALACECLESCDL